MPIDALLLAAVLASAPVSSEPAPSETAPVHARRGPARWYETSLADPRRFSVAGHFEAQLIGLAFGVHGEFLYRPFRADRGANLRVGVSLAGGPEFFYLPLALGWRQHFVPHHRVTLELGAGYEQQSFFVPGLDPVTRSAFYGEGGVAIRVIEQGFIGTQVIMSWAPFERPGPGLGLRLGFRWNFGPRRGAKPGP